MTAKNIRERIWLIPDGIPLKLDNLIIEYQMAYDDAGKVGIGLCSEIEGKLNWYIDR